MNKTKTSNSIYFLGAFFVFSSFGISIENTVFPTESGYTLKVIIKNMRNKAGRLQLDLYKNNDEFEKRKSDTKRRAYVDKSDAHKGEITYTYTHVPEGIYGLALFDDENSNGKIDYGWILPKEGFAFGDYYHTKWSSPHFNDFKFTLKSNKTSVMVVRYL